MNKYLIFIWIISLNVLELGNNHDSRCKKIVSKEPTRVFKIEESLKWMEFWVGFKGVGYVDNIV